MRDLTNKDIRFLLDVKRNGSCVGVDYYDCNDQCILRQYKYRSGNGTGCGVPERATKLLSSIPIEQIFEKVL